MKSDGCPEFPTLAISQTVAVRPDGWGEYSGIFDNRTLVLITHDITVGPPVLPTDDLTEFTAWPTMEFSDLHGIYCRYWEGRTTAGSKVRMLVRAIPEVPYDPATPLLLAAALDDNLNPEQEN